jgi:hypothetical protein
MKKIKPKLAISLNVFRLDLGQIASDQPGAYPIEVMKRNGIDRKMKRGLYCSLTENRWTKNNASNNLTNNLWLSNV